MSEELKRCPFCGGPAYLVWPKNRDFGQVKCLTSPCNAVGGRADTRRAAIELWNTRAETPQSIPSEREEIVKWLRTGIRRSDWSAEFNTAFEYCAKSIERGEHLSTRQAPKEGSAKCR